MSRSRVITMLAVCLLGASTSEAQDAAKVARGQELYVAQKCAICHAIAGKGNAKGALDGVGAKLSADETRQWIVNASEMTAKTKATRSRR